MTSATVHPFCCVCGADRAVPHSQHGEWTLVRCAGCTHVYLSPRPDDATLLRDVYDASYWRSAAARDRGYRDYLGSETLALRTWRLRARHLEPHFPHAGRVLDVGCAGGHFLRVLRAHGWDVHGVEPSVSMAAVARRQLGAERVHTGTLRDAPHAPQSFDLVTLWDVLEHVPDPRETLIAAAALLRPGGRLLIETQDVESVAARVLGARWHHYKCPEHLHHFSRTTLERLFTRSGLRFITCTRRNAGKHVDGAFVSERAARVSKLASRCLTPLAPLLARGLYVNLYDELVIVAAKSAAPSRLSSLAAA